MSNEVEAVRTGDRGTVRAMVEVLSATRPRRGLTDLFPFLGPAFVAAVAYVDPGNFATNLQGGAQYGYTLLWVIVAANLMGMLVQSLSAKLGIASGRNLAEVCREHFPAWLVWGMWALMELVAMATDLAEFVGAALGLSLLFGLPLPVSGLLTAAATFALLGIQRFGFRPIEALVGALVALVAGAYVIELVLVKPDWRQVAYHAVVPEFEGWGSVYLACGILGATVMPHVIFLHSALMQERLVTRDPEQQRRLHRFEVIDIVAAMGVAGLINAAMLVMAAKTFHSQGMVQIDALDKAYLTLEPLLGRFASVLFAVSLLAAGLSSSVVGTMSGQVIMQGFLRRHIPVWLRRIVTTAPALLVLLLGVDPTAALVLSQVVLSFGLPFALVPLVMFTRRRDIMGTLANRPITTWAAGTVTALVIALNVFLLVRLMAA